MDEIKCRSTAFCHMLSYTKWWYFVHHSLTFLTCCLSCVPFLLVHFEWKHGYSQTQIFFFLFIHQNHVLHCMYQQGKSTLNLCINSRVMQSQRFAIAGCTRAQGLHLPDCALSFSKCTVQCWVTFHSHTVKRIYFWWRY